MKTLWGLLFASVFAFAESAGASLDEGLGEKLTAQTSRGAFEAAGRELNSALQAGFSREDVLAVVDSLDRYGKDYRGRDECRAAAADRVVFLLQAYDYAAQAYENGYDVNPELIRGALEFANGCLRRTESEALRLAVRVIATNETQSTVEFLAGAAGKMDKGAKQEAIIGLSQMCLPDAKAAVKRIAEDQSDEVSAEFARQMVERSAGSIEQTWCGTKRMIAIDVTYP